MKRKIQKIRCVCAFLACALFVSGCSLTPEEQSGGKKESEKSDTGFLLTGPGSYDSADTAVIFDIDRDDCTITFYNYTVSKKYTLHYDGATTYSDKYGQAMSLAQIAEGDIVDITFLKSKKRLDTLQTAQDSWSNEAAEKYEINAARHDISVGSDIYKLTSDTLIFSDGQQIELMDLNSADVLTFRGVGSSIYSIVVEKGHGYLRLKGDENFIGGWIEVGQSMIRPIAEDMLLTVPEGSYDVNISLRGSGGVKRVVINRNQEVTLDIGDLEVAEVKCGKVLFAVTPSNATLYVDAAKVDAGAPVELEYGIHQLMAVAPGYDTVTSYFRVAEPSGGLEVVMERETADKNETHSSTGSSTADNTESSTADSGVNAGSYQVYIDAPEEAEVYVDGNYIGIAPISFKKAEGAHIVTLRRTGYETRSYTIQVDNEEKDITYSFAELAPVGLKTE